MARNNLIASLSLVVAVASIGCGDSTSRPPAADGGTEDISKPEDRVTPADNPAPTDNPAPSDVVDAGSQDVSTTDVTDAGAQDVPSADVVSDQPVADVPAADVPGTDVPVIDVPVADVPVVDVPVADVPVVDVPVVDVPAADVAAADAGPGTMYVATLQGAQEVPPVYNAAGSGSATLTLSGDRTSLSYTITHTLPSVMSAHIHIGIAGTNGAVAIGLTPTPGSFSGTATLTSAQADAIAQGRAYINLHTAANPGGEIRGQITLPGERVWVARLTGAQEVPAVSTAATGNAQLLLAQANDRIRYVVESTLTPTAGHIHTAPGAANGSVAYDLLPASVTPGMIFAGSVAVTPTSVTSDMFNGRWYVNLHTAANPGGEIRGQVLRPGEVLYTTFLNGANEVPPVTTTAAGSLAVIRSADRARLVYEGTFTGLTTNAAHLHVAPAGMNGNVAVTLTLVGGSPRGTADVPSTPANFLDQLEMGNVYANAHTTANPGGEIRGQMVRR